MPDSPRVFNAPWSSALWAISLIVSLLLIAVVLVGIYTNEPNNVLGPLFLVGLPILILLVSYFFMIRGYELDGNRMFVRRLLWRNSIPLDELQSVRVDPTAASGSWKVFGNGGLFSFSGLFRNKSLGTYRAWATDLARTVVLEYPRRNVVVTPDRPEAFVEALREIKGWPREEQNAAEAGR